MLVRYTRLIQIVASDHTVSEEEGYILTTIKKILESGEPFTKATVREIVESYAEPRRRAAFDSDEVQTILEFLCEQFEVPLAQYDTWVRELGLPVPDKTAQRHNEARRRRVEFFDNDVIARHWHNNFHILQRTKDLKSWFPEEIVDAINSRVAQPEPKPPTSPPSMGGRRPFRAIHTAPSANPHAGF
mmetsp:Transcript_27635/g.65545  ORF Transcript_27635/g.65545 Transcript_27635/m.65545 type:complete len:187 (-) Transcript_27635:86-646(-)